MPMDFLAKSERKATPTTLAPWKVLIVDDDQEVHEATRIALSGCRLEERGLKLYHALSMAEAKPVLEENKDIAVALIDVVMETDTAGLDLVSWIRHDLANPLIRLVLRTGQPGYAPQIDVIQKYEIDDYKEKSELTRAKLVTTIVTGLRGFKLLTDLENNRCNLKTLNLHFADLVEKNSVRDFAGGVLEQIGSLVGVAPEGLVCAVDRDTGEEERPAIRVLAAAGAYVGMVDRPLEAIPSEEVRNSIMACIATGETQHQPFSSCLALKTRGGLRAAIHVGIPYAVLQRLLGEEVLQLFVMNSRLGYEKTALMEHIHRLAYEDHVTGLYSYAAFLEKFRRVHGTGRALSVLLLDIQRFRMIEHGIGDEKIGQFLKKVGIRLKSGFPNAHVVARKEVDEFLIVLDAVPAERLSQVVDVIEGLFNEPITVGDNVFNIRMRVGIANSGDHGDDPEQLARYASIALNDLRQRGIGTYAVFNPAMQEVAFERLRLTSLLTGTAGKTEFLVYFQPILQADTENLYSCEALMRFRTSAGDFLNTQRMIEAAEASGMILDVGAWMLKSAMSDYMAMGRNTDGIHLNLNLSPKQAQSSRIYADIDAAIEATGMPLNRLVFEVTEGLFLNNDQETISFLEWIRKNGGKVVIDDFGTGYSSFSYLRKLPVDGIKVDRAFITNMDQDDDALAVVRSILAVAQALGLEVTAEGVETLAQRNILRDLGCTYLQGYLYSKAVPNSELAGFIQRANEPGFISIS
ncbi:diguanylate cyclase [Roseibium aquae]|uniref:Diguanylate cyclase n=1 Tax=Roseibium aquae TaxID=1323746 RepID=A0A916TLI1_9HYPH|nr:EAL domain-containing protein [Roseibium aquae]GGB53624.1 diguanylate cyclase [Roseibium aquae]